MLSSLKEPAEGWGIVLSCSVSHGVVRPDGRGSSVVMASFIVRVDVLELASYIFELIIIFFF